LPQATGHPSDDEVARRVPRRLVETGEVGPDRGQAGAGGHLVPDEGAHHLIREETRIGRPRTGVNEIGFLIRSAAASARHLTFPLEHSDDLILGEELPDALHVPVHGEGGSHHDAHLHDFVGVVDLLEFGGDAEFGRRIPGVLLQGVALGAAHAQNLYLHAFLRIIS
jgi:hypothetical protein